MGSDSNRVLECSLPGDSWLDIFALVIYIPDPLGRFLDDLRLRLAPGCNPHAHVSVLPPREIPDAWEMACEQARAQVESWPPFVVEATGVNLFPSTDVVYLEVGAGAAELRRMHRAMNADRLQFAERFEYHPHITLAQEIPPGRVEETLAEARRAWKEYDGPRSFLAEQAAFVRNSQGNRWGDLGVFSLGAVGARVG